MVNNMELLGVLILLAAGFFIYVGVRVHQVYKEVELEHRSTSPHKSDSPLLVMPGVTGMQKAMVQASKAMGAIIQMPTTIAAYDLVHTGNTYNLVKTGWNWQDIWVGLYWKFDSYYEGEAGDYDRLRLYICLLPCYLVTIDRIRHYKVVPRADARIDPVCRYCGERHSTHPVMLNETESCTGRY